MPAWATSRPGNGARSDAGALRHQLSAERVVLRGLRGVPVLRAVDVRFVPLTLRASTRRDLPSIGPLAWSCLRLR